MKPAVSILIPTFNAATTLPLTLSSVITQTFDDWECIIVDDGSTDSTNEVVHAFADKRIRYVKFPRNRGRGVARQHSLDIARADYLAFLDADDWMYPDRLKTQVEQLDKHPEAVLTGSSMTCFSSNGEITGSRCHSASQVPELTGPHRGLTRFKVPFPATMVRTRNARQIGFQSSLRRSQDAAFLYSVLQGKKYIHDPRPTTAYRTDQRSPKRISRAYLYTARMYLSFSDRFPAESILFSSLSVLKAGVALTGVNLANLSSRSGLAGREVSELERTRFAETLKSLRRLAEQTWPESHERVTTV